MTDLTKPTDLDGRVWAESGTITSPDTLDILDGWDVGEKPPAQFFNYWQNRTDKFLSYLMQKGIPEWDINTLFIANKSFVTQNGNVYLAKQTHSGQNPSLDITFVYWKLILGNTEVLYKPEVVTNVAALRLVSSAGVKNASTRGYYTAGDGGHAEYWYDAADTISADNGGSVIVAVDGARWKLRVSDTVNVKQFGAKGDGIIDDTASILSAVSFAGGRLLYFPKGTYPVTAELPLSVIGSKIVGESRFTTLIKQNTLNAKILNISQMFCGVSGLSFIYNGTPTSGATAINVTGSYATLEDFVIRSCHIGVEFNGCVAGKLSNYEILDYESIGLYLLNVNDVFSHSFIFNAGNTTRGALGGIRLVDKVEAFVATDGDILMGQYSLTTDAGVNGLGTRPAYNNFTNVFFDSSTLGSLIEDLVETEFVGCWFSGGRSGVGSSGVNISTSDSVRFTNTRFFNCGAAGCVVNASTKNVFFTACDFESNSVTTGAGVAHGVSIASGTQGFVFDSCKFGNGLYTGQQGYGAFIDTGCDKFAFTNNIFDSNLTGSIYDNATTATDKNFSSNVGHVDPSSDVTLTNVAAIRARYRNGATNITTDGYYTAGDGGHARYRYDATDVVTADNGFTVIVGADGARWKLLSEDGEVNVKSFGAVGDGVTDDSVAIQAALNSGTLSVVIPDGTFLCDNLLMPATFGFVLRGNGVSSRLKQKSSANPLIRWSTASINYTEGYIKDLAFIGTNGGNNTINTAGVGGLTLQNLYFTDVPTGYSSVYVNGAAATYVHDTRLKNIQIYSNLAGSAGIRFGSLVADTTLDGFIMNGGFTTDYCLLFDSGAVTVRVSNSHPYNAKINVMKMSGSNTNCGFTGVTFDNALSDIIHITSGSLNIFSNCHIQAVKSGYSGVILVNSSNNTLSNTMFDGAVGSLSCAVETGTSNGNIIVGGNINLAINFATPFSLIGAESYAKGLNGYADFGLMYSFTGCTSTAQAQNTTQFLGANGGQAAMNNTAFLVPHSTLVKTAYIAVVSTPAVGQTFTFNLKNGSTTIGTLVVSNGGFGGTITSNTAVSAYSQISIESIFSATSGSSDVRYSINMLS